MVGAAFGKALQRSCQISRLAAVGVIILSAAAVIGWPEAGLFDRALGQIAATPRAIAPAKQALRRAPVVRIRRDDQVVTLDMDYNASRPAQQFWTMSGSPDDDAGFLVTWWPQGANRAQTGTLPWELAEALCISPASLSASGGTILAQLPAAPPALKTLPEGARWLVTANRRVQLQPLENNRAYVVRVQRLSARGQISSLPAELSFNGGDGSRVEALRSSLTFFDDFNRPVGPVDTKLWNNASSVQADPRFNLLFINDQLHVHTLHGTLVKDSGDKSQTSHRFRKKVRIEADSRRRIVFDMDSPLSPRSVWYLDLNPIPAELTGHTGFFDENNALGLPAGMLRLRSQGQRLSVHIVDMSGASHEIASVNMEEAGRQSVTNVRRNFDVQVGTTGVEVSIDGLRVINANFGAHSLAPADYELLWVGFGYNTDKDGVPYFLQHWDNFGFDGPVVDERTVHDYVTRIAGTDYRAARRGAPASFSINIPDDLRPIKDGATAEAWLVFIYQPMGNNPVRLGPEAFVRVNNDAKHPLPQPINNTVPLNPAAGNVTTPYTARIKLGDIVKGGRSPLVVGTNVFEFAAETAGILNVHVEVLYPPGSAPAYTPPSALHPVPMHTDLPRLGPPVRLQRVGSVNIGPDHHITNPNRASIELKGRVPLNIEAGNSSWAEWAPQLMRVPVQSLEVWATGGTSGFSQIEVFLQRKGASGGWNPVMRIDTAVDAPAPQGRYRVELDSRSFENGDYELSVVATTPSGVKSHPSYGDTSERFDAAQLSGAYYPIAVRINN